MLNTLKTHITFLFYIMIASALYALGNFYESSKNAEKKSLYIILLISLAFAFVEYIIKIPTYYYHKKIYTPSQMQMVWLMMTSFMVILYRESISLDLNFRDIESIKYLLFVFTLY